MLKRIVPIEDEVKNLVVKNIEKIAEINDIQQRGYVQMCWLPGKKLTLIIGFTPLNLLLTADYQNGIATSGNYVEKLIEMVKAYDPKTQIVVGYQGLDLETYSVTFGFE